MLQNMHEVKLGTSHDGLLYSMMLDNYIILSLSWLRSNNSNMFMKKVLIFGVIYKGTATEQL